MHTIATLQPHITVAVAAPPVHSVRIFDFSAGRYVDIRHNDGEFSVILPANEADAARGLLAVAEIEMEKANEHARRANMLRQAAWLLLEGEANKQSA